MPDPNPAEEWMDERLTNNQRRVIARTVRREQVARREAIAERDSWKGIAEANAQGLNAAERKLKQFQRNHNHSMDVLDAARKGRAAAERDLARLGEVVEEAIAVGGMPVVTARSLRAALSTEEDS